MKFTDALSIGDYERAQEYAAPGILAQDESGRWRVVADNCSTDAEEFRKASFKRVIRGGAGGDQVIFRLRSRADYAIVKNGRIVRLKLP